MLMENDRNTKGCIGVMDANWAHLQWIIWMDRYEEYDVDFGVECNRFLSVYLSVKAHSTLYIN